MEKNKEMACKGEVSVLKLIWNVNFKSYDQLSETINLLEQTKVQQLILYSLSAISSAIPFVKSQCTYFCYNISDSTKTATEVSTYNSMGTQGSCTVSYYHRGHLLVLSKCKFSLPLSNTVSIFITSFQTAWMEIRSISSKHSYLRFIKFSEPTLSIAEGKWSTGSMEG